MAAATLLASPALAAQIGTRTTYPLAAVTALQLNQSNAGQSFRVDPTAGAVTCTLPALTSIAGCRWRVIKSNAAANAITITSPTAASLYAGLLVNAATLTPGAATSIIIAAGAAAGAWVEVFCDGLTVQVTGTSTTANGLAVA